MIDETTDAIEKLENFIATAEKDVALPDNASANLNDDTDIIQPVSTNTFDPAETKNKPEDPVAIEAFEHLKTIFHTHFHNAMSRLGNTLSPLSTKAILSLHWQRIKGKSSRKALRI